MRPSKDWYVLLLLWSGTIERAAHYLRGVRSATLGERGPLCVVSGLGWVENPAHRERNKSLEGLLGLPQRVLRPDEHPITTAERETREETGLIVRVTDFFGIWLGVYDVPDDPEPPKRLMNVVYLAGPVGGELTSTPEAPQAKWFQPDEIPMDRVYPEKHFAFEAWRSTVPLGKKVWLPDRPRHS
jgi:ADP-ribose pyrophosphatase YjhB (NUDIX family)